jgi:hypothetical protein
MFADARCSARIPCDSLPLYKASALPTIEASALRNRVAIPIMDAFALLRRHPMAAVRPTPLTIGTWIIALLIGIFIGWYIWG